jgi:hypothetical protein
MDRNTDLTSCAARDKISMAKKKADSDDQAEYKHVYLWAQ